MPELIVACEGTRFVCAVFQAIQQINWTVATPGTQRSSTPETILQSLLTYCYAVGLLASEEVAAAVTRDPVARYLSAGHRPDADAIRTFRRRHAPFLTLALTQLFRNLENIRTETDSSQFFQRQMRIEKRTRCASLAKERVARAIQEDSHALDF